MMKNGFEKYHKIRYRYVLYMVIFASVLLMFIYPISNVQAEPNDGKISEDDNYENVRVIDFSIANNAVPIGSQFESSAVIGNYGVEEKQIDMEWIIRNEDGDPIPENDFSMQPHQEQITLEPGENKAVSSFIRISETGQYIIYPSIGNEITDENYAGRNVLITGEGSGTTIQQIVDRKKDNELSNNPLRFHDELDGADDRFGFTDTIPPDNDDTKGVIRDFSNMIDERDATYGTIDPSEDGVNIGLSFERLQNMPYYSIDVKYDSDEDNSIKLELVDSNGNEIDTKTNYYIGNNHTESDEIDSRVINLSSLETQYVNSQNDIFIKFKSDDIDEDDTIDLYDIRIEGSDQVHDFEEDSEIELNIQKDASDNPPVYITAEIENKGNSPIMESFTLRETSPAYVDAPVENTRETLINPDDTVDISFDIYPEQSGDYIFSLDDEEETINISESFIDEIQDESLINRFGFVPIDSTNRQENVVDRQRSPVSITNILINRW